VDRTSDLATLTGTCADRPAAENWAAVDDAIHERMRELRMPVAQLARETGLSETTIRDIGVPDRGHRQHALVAISAVLRWRYNHLTNILRGQPHKNTPARPGAAGGLERLLHAEVGPLKDDVSRLTEAIYAIDDKLGTRRPVPRQDCALDPGELRPKPEAISDLPMLNDMDADYSPQYVKLARILRDRIKSGDLSRFASLPAAHLSTDYHVSAPVAYAALEMLAANRYVGRPGGTRYYRVTWDTTHPHARVDS
jgi:hypothetical protein